jgi:hypothetical protein
MQTLSAASFSRLEMSAALLVGSVALLMLGLQPILLGEMVARQVITLEGVGIVAMGEIIALGLGVVLGDAVLPLSRYRLIMVIAAVAVAVFNVATCYGAGDAPLAALRAVAGLAEGVLVWVTTNIIVRSAKPDRLAAVFIVVQTLSQAGIAALLAVLIVPRAGWQGGFVLVAVISLLVSLLVRFLPAGLKPLRAEGAQPVSWSFATLLPLVIVFFQMAAIGSLWAYLEPLGRAAGFDDQGAQTLISSVLVMQVYAHRGGDGAGHHCLCDSPIAAGKHGDLLRPVGGIRLYLVVHYAFSDRAGVHRRSQRSHRRSDPRHAVTGQRHRPVDRLFHRLRRRGRPGAPGE